MRDVCCLELIDWTSKVLKKAWGLEAPLPGVMAQTSWLRSRGIKTQQRYFWFLLSPWRSVRVQDSQWSQVEHFHSAGSMLSWPFACIMYDVWRSTLDHPAGQDGGCRHRKKGLWLRTTRSWSKDGAWVPVPERLASTWAHRDGRAPTSWKLGQGWWRKNQSSETSIQGLLTLVNTALPPLWSPESLCF